MEEGGRDGRVETELDRFYMALDDSEIPSCDTSNTYLNALCTEKSGATLQFIKLVCGATLQPVNQ
eukprot:scaffold2047_cov129-Cylindrotheca_fusiformis.AAC.3